jgi:hypothetical protein
MPWVSIGHCGHSTTPGDTFEFELGIEYLKLVCGEVPESCELDVMWQEFDGTKTGEIVDLPAGVGLAWDDTIIPDAPWDYMSRCRTALEIFDEAVDWAAIHPEAVNRQIQESEADPNEMQEQEDDTFDEAGSD